MDGYYLDVTSPIRGGYLSSEQIDLLSIIQCRDSNELVDFIINCDQIKKLFTKEDLYKLIDLPLDDFKRIVFKSYQDTMVFHDSDREVTIENKLKHCGILEEDIEIIKKAVLSNQEGIIPWLREFIKNKYPNNYEEIFVMNHHFESTERDQLKAEDLYEEMTILNSNLDSFNSILIGSGKIYSVVNDLYDESNPDKRYDFYSAKRDLDFAYKNGKQVRFHSLLVKEDCNLFMNGNAYKSKEEILEIIREYVKSTIDFITEYNNTHKIIINGKEEPVINAVDLFNEIISFEKNEKNEYYSIWESRFGITMPELLSCFDYAYQNKPNGVSFLYNEPFLEDEERRKKVLETLFEIDTLRPGLIDTLGTQMHITVRQNKEDLERCYEDFKKLQESTGKKIQITEFDMSLGSQDVPRVFGPNSDISLEMVYEEKERKIKEISEIIEKSGVKLEGVSYWSLTDGIDCNLERQRSKALSKHEIKHREEIPTVCGGLIPTHRKLKKNMELKEMLDDLQNNSNKTNNDSLTTTK